MLRARLILFNLRVLNTMSHIRWETPQCAVWPLELFNKIDITFLTCNNLYLKSSSLAIKLHFGSVQFMNSLMTQQSDDK